MRNWSKIFTALLLWGIFAVNAQEKLKTEDLFDLSLEELLKIEIVRGTITGIETGKTPVSFTLINREMIKLTPARNLLDLMEVYVPGFTFVNHWLGPRIAFRGIAGDQNNSFLLLVDGKRVNMKAKNGPIFEIQNKDLDDIERIEVIHGPGSVTYGPGAIGGIFNIITKKHTEKEGREISAEYNNLYNYGKAAASYNFTSGDFSAYLYGSITTSEGISDPKFYYVDRAHGYGYGFMGFDWGNKGLGTPAPRFYEDFIGRPEIKLDFDASFPGNFSLSARYNRFSFTKQQQETVTLDGLNFPGMYGQYFFTTLEQEHNFNNAQKIVSSVEFMSQSFREYNFYMSDQASFDDIRQRSDSWSENEIKIKTEYDYTPSKGTRFALGGSFLYEYYGPEWGLEDNTFILGFQAPIRFAILDTTSGFYQQFAPGGFATYIDERIGAWMASVYGEVNLTLSDNLTLLLSGRVDKHQFAKLAFSPRAAAIYNFNERNLLKLIVQQSVRLPNFIDLYSENKISSASAKPEKLFNLEIIYNSFFTKEYSLSVSAYYNTVDQIAWVSDEEKADVVGNFAMLGAEAGLNINRENMRAGVNLSYIGQLNWEAENLPDAFLTSPAPDLVRMELDNFAENRINNLPAGAIKMFYNRNLPYNLTLHIDGRFYWNYGQKEMLDIFMSSHEKYGNASTIAEMRNIYTSLEDEGYTKPSFTSNVSLAWKLPVDFAETELVLYAMNLLSVNHIRYVYQFWESGNMRQYPRQAGFVEEPLAIGTKLFIKF